MDEHITRKQFLGRLAGGTVVLLLLDACGGGGDDDGGGMAQPPASTCGAASISDNHGHALSIQKTDLDSTVDKTYSIMGSATHSHSVTLTVAQLAQLKAGNMVTVTSSTADAHSHEVTVRCA